MSDESDDWTAEGLRRSADELRNAAPAAPRELSADELERFRHAIRPDVHHAVMVVSAVTPKEVGQLLDHIAAQSEQIKTLTDTTQVLKDALRNECKKHNSRPSGGGGGCRCESCKLVGMGYWAARGETK